MGETAPPDIPALLAGVRADVVALTQRQGWQHDYLTRLAHLITEVGELVQELVDEPTEAAKQRIGAEIYDVVWNAVDLGRLLDIDLDAAFTAKRKYNETRTWQ
jgi:NTP pyrophosphatase (non-canonical NTP hydrolase)